MKRYVHLRCRGSTMLLVVIVVAVMLVLGAGVLTLGLYGRLFGIRTAADISARCAADAGLTKAVAAMNQKLKVKPWDGATLPQEADQPLPNFDAMYSYQVGGDGSAGYSVHTVGICGSRERTADSTLRLAGPWDFAVFARRNIDLKANTVVDWFNFDADDDVMKVGTNSTAAGAITLKNATLVNGDVVVGVNGTPSTVINCFPGVNITGRTYAMPEEHEMPAVTVPQDLLVAPSKGSVDVKTKKSATISTSGRYDRIDVGVDGIIIIDEPVCLYVTGDIGLGTRSMVQIGGPNDTDNDARLVLYLGGNMTGNNSSGFNNLAKDATRFEFYGLSTCRTIDFKNDGDFYGAIYAPDAQTILRNSGDVYGSIACDSFELKASAVIHYDAALRDRTVNDELVRFVIKRWTEE